MNSNQSPMDQQTNKNSRFKFLVVVVLFVLPVAAAVTLHLSGWRPGSTMNHGKLVQPARPMPDLSLGVGDSGQRGTQDVDQKWKLLVVTGSGCNEACLKNLFAIRQIQTGQGKHQHRVQRMFIHQGAVSDMARIRASYPEMLVLEVNPVTMNGLRDWLSIGNQEKTPDGSTVYMIDPLGNYMMYYAPGYKPAGMRKDLARLLRVSRIG